jgi:YggT family protein
MFALANVLRALADVLDIALNLYMWLIIAQAVLTWVNPDPYNPIVRFLYSVTEPVLSRVRRMLPVFFGGIDFSPMVVIFAIYFLQRFLVPTLHEMASRLYG